MSFGKRRPKPLRAQLRPATTPLSIQQGRLARQRDRFARLTVVAVAVLATAAVVHGSGPPFTYRIGQKPDRELRVKVREFKRLNQKKTNAERQVEVDQIAPSMVNDPAPIRDLAERLDDLTVTAARTSAFEALPENLRDFWKLTPEAFDELKTATDTPERRDELHREIAKAFEPLLRDGVLGYDTLPRNEESSRTLAIRGPGQKPTEAHYVPRERVVPERVSKPDGPAARAFVAAFGPSQRLGPILFKLVADKLAGTPTLSYEEQ
ncbi:MAG: hypothetical protein LC745_11270, partial [Planctomycetia bacterium]|nr:hypothetical protein [Planctomycetia bacterium]